MTAKKQRSLEKKIAELKAVTRGERNLYSYIRDLLTRKEFGVELRPDQIVVDVAVAGGRATLERCLSSRDGRPQVVTT